MGEPKHPLVVRLVLREQQPRLALAVQEIVAKFGIGRRNAADAVPRRDVLARKASAIPGHHVQTLRNQSVGST